MTVRAKFIVQSITRRNQSVYNYETKRSEMQEVQSIEMWPVTGDGNNAENHQFFASTPSGKIELNTLNPAAVEEFAASLGQAVYVDFTPAEEA
jgi:hypothetical protein